MLHHISFGVSDLLRSAAFYDAALGALGFRRVFEDDDAVGYGLEDDKDLFCLKLREGVRAPGNGFHLAFRASSHAAVNSFYNSALVVAGECNGAPGLRPDYGDNYYAAFLIDPDGYPIEVVYNGR